MGSAGFEFKKFTVRQERSAMKVGTDAVLLGAWSIRCVESEKMEKRIARILDIGTGTGVLALMMAQTFSQVRIAALEIDGEAFSEAKSNFEMSPYAGRMEVHHLPVQEYAPEASFDLILSNPPYFSGSLLPEVKSRERARHTLTLSMDELLASAYRLLMPSGLFCVILPFEQAAAFRIGAIAKGWLLLYQCLVRDQAGRPVKRVLLALGKVPGSWQNEEIFLKKEDGSRSLEFARLTSAFYL